MKKLLLTLLVVFLSCKKQDKTMCAKIIFYKNAVFVDGKQINENIELCSKQTIETKINSSAVVRFSDHAVITVKQNSKLSLVKAKDLDPHKIYVNLRQDYGSTFSNVKKNKADYFITTPTIVAGVRGTAFEVITTETVTEIKMLEGMVFLKRANTPVPIDAERFKVYVYADEKVVINKTRIETPQQITAQEKDKLKFMAQIDPGTKDLSFYVFDNLSKDSATLQVAPEKRAINKLTIEELKKLYGRLSIIRTKDGYEYIGSFKQDGAKMIVFTATKTFSINTANIEKVLPYDK